MIDKMRIDHNFNLKKYSAMKIGPKKATIIYLEKKEDLTKVYTFAKENKKKIHFLGESTNSIFDETSNKKYIFLKSNLKNFTCIKRQRKIICEIGGGLIWDEAVSRTVKLGYSGLEALSGIPGTIGAGPVQNIGAYGKEIADSLLSVLVYDIKNQKEIKLTKEKCDFSYRNSVFKKNPGKYFILSVTFILSLKKPEIPKYRDIQNYFINNKNLKPKIDEIRKAVILIRQKKLPKYKTTPNLGSYFKNPIISKEKAEKLSLKFPEIPKYSAKGGSAFGGKVKIPAGWLLEKAGFKGFKKGNLGIYKKNSLVVTTNGVANSKQLLKFESEIVGKIKEIFDIKLEREPIFVK